MFQREKTLSAALGAFAALLFSAAVYETYISFIRVLTAYTPVARYAWGWTWPGSYLVVAWAKLMGMHPSLSPALFSLPSVLFLGIAATLVNLLWSGAILFLFAWLIKTAKHRIAA
jgi:hypothetical protein